MKKYLSLMSKGTKVKCLGVIVLALIGAILASIWPVRLGVLYTDIAGGNISLAAQGILCIVQFGMIYLVAECITILRRVLLDCIIAGHEAQMHETSIEKLLKMPVAYYDDGLSGEKTAQLNQGVSGLSQLIKITCNDIFATVLTAICTLVQVVINAPLLLAGIMLLYLVSTVLISAFQIRSQNGIRENIITQKNALDGQICQSISNLELIRSMNACDYEKKRLNPDIWHICVTEKKHHRYMGTFDSLKQVCKIVFQVAILLLSILMITNGKMSAGTVITVCLLFQQLVKPIDEVYRFMDETATAVVKAKVLIELTDSGSDPIFGVSDNEIQTLDSDIVLNEVVITEPKRRKRLSYYPQLRIPGNSIVAVRGESGCGKTTLMRCLNRFYPYIAGNITLFGQDLDFYSQKKLTDNLVYVPQKAFFFAGTVRDNLKYGVDRHVSDAEMVNALRKACLFDVLLYKVSKKSNVDICDDYEVLNYVVGEAGKGLSGGEGQRLAIARAFLRKPKLYIFDESTANLDQNTASMILDQIENHAREINAGVIYISHDENVVKRCKEVVWIKNALTDTNLSNDKLVA